MQDLLIKSRKNSWKRNSKNPSEQFITERAEMIGELLKYAGEGSKLPNYNLTLIIL